MVTTEGFGTTRDGQKVTAYTIDHAGIRCRVLDFGAVLANLWTPDRNGKLADVILGFDRLEQYESNKDFFGALVGPVCNRTALGRFCLDGHWYQMPVNDGPNNLHTDSAHGLHKKHWEATVGENAVTFTVTVPDGESGLPGNRAFTVTYHITEEAGLQIRYHATTDRRTYLNLTNHAYFNLDGNAAGSSAVMNTSLQLFCSHYTPLGKGSIPTGEIAPVEGTPFDFREARTIGRDIEAAHPQLELAGGYDHNFVIDGYQKDGMTPVLTAVAVSAKSGRRMETYTTLPGVQFYTGNYVDDPDGKEGHDYGRRAAFCLETQFYPDSVNHPSFPQAVSDADHPYDACTEYRFSVV